MPTIRVPDQPSIIITEGGEPTIYKVKDGKVKVDDAHVAAILGAIQGSELVVTGIGSEPASDKGGLNDT